MDPSQREVAAATATYAGSPEHKLPHARSGATLCPADLQSVQPMLTDWIRASILAGWTGGIEEGGYPRYVWRRDGDRYFEGRLTNQSEALAYHLCREARNATSDSRQHQRRRRECD
jgi:hypothetical protein